MNSNNDIKQTVKQKYAEIVVSQDSCCGPSGCCGDVEYSVFSDDYSTKEGYLADADLNLGCGLPVEYAGIKKGDTILDLGSGAGNDIFVARSVAGENATLIGVDFTPEMIAKANINKMKVGFDNVEFRLGDIEDMPVDSNSVDVVISNCVLNLVPDKTRAFSEILRVLKPGGHFCVSDVVTLGEMPEDIKKSAELYAGCVSGALDKSEYMSIISALGFENIEIKAEKVIKVPDSEYLNYISPEQLEMMKSKNFGIFSITVTGYKN